MNTGTVRWSLFLLFFVSLVTSGTLVALTYWRGEIYADTFHAVLLRLWAAYSGPLGVILGWLAGTRRKDSNKNASRHATKLGVAAAIGLAIIWNLMVAGRVGSFALAEGETVGELVSYFETVVPVTYPLVGGALGFYFGRRESEA